jgi:membrane-associated phospholipid phosphatase
LKERSTVDEVAALADHRRPWSEAFLWLILLGPGFLALYAGANAYTAQLPPEKVAEIGMAWERFIPFWPWSILLYMSIDLLYLVSPFLCRTRQELRIYALRFIAVTVVSVIAFLLFPLRFGAARPEVSGVPGVLFQALGYVDRPFNQAPSLHIGLLVVLWSCYRTHCPPAWRWLLNLIAVGIAYSVLTTWQHHFLDVPSGLLVGVVACLLIRQRAQSAS